MTGYARLEIGLHHYDARSYRLDASFRLSQEDARRRHSAEIPHFDLDALALNRSDPETHGPMLTQALFATETLRTFFAEVRAITIRQQPPLGLRLSLFVGPTLPGLHTLRWETLRDPARPDALLALDQNILFSRYLSSADWRQVQPPSRAELNALVVIANPGDLPRYQMAPVDVPGELARAEEGLGNIPLQALCRPESPTDNVVGQPTREQILDRLREGCEILFLVAHGKLYDGDPIVWLEASDGSTHRVPAGGPDGLVTRLAQLPQLPYLVVLASCQSGGDGRQPSSTDGGALSALGPRLAEIGVPAVVAMQDNVAMETVKKFMPPFFGELQASGQIDRAVAVARGAVRECHDWWVPVLYTRLESGRLFTPESAATETDAQAGPEPPQAEGYDLRVVRQLLLAGFSAKTLPRLLRYSANAKLRQAVNGFSPNDGLTDLVDKTVQYCEDRVLLAVLLAEVERENPGQYARFEDRLAL
jgi:hypothetical protein